LVWSKEALKLSGSRRFAIASAWGALLLLSPFLAWGSALSGSWEGQISLPVNTLDLEMEWMFAFDFDVDGLSAGAEMEFSDDFDILTVFADSSFGTMSVSSEAVFSAGSPFFKEATLSASASAQGIRWKAETSIGSSVSSAELTLELSGATGFGSLGATITTKLCPLRFDAVEIDASLSDFCCVEDADITLDFDCSGFNSLSMSISGISPPVPWVSTGTFDIDYFVDDKVLQVKYGFDGGSDDSCVSLGVGFPAGVQSDSLGPEVVIRSIGVTCNVGDVRASLMATHEWDSIDLSGSLAGCGTATWRLRFYSKPDSQFLFDLHTVSGGIQLTFCPALRFGMAVERELAGDTTFEFTFGGAW